MLVFVGTLHCNLTPHGELIELIESFEPSRLLIEMAQKDIEGKKLEKYPDEMRAVLFWATVRKVYVHGIDSSIETLKEGTLEDDLKTLDKEQRAIIGKHDWKEFNKPELYGALETETWQKVIDVTKDDKRNLKMYKNIISQVDPSDSVVSVVITGSGHIPFFRSKFPNAQFPLS